MIIIANIKLAAAKKPIKITQRRRINQNQSHSPSLIFANQSFMI
ncbi:MAG: hypothetical protein MRECE_16c007 [Mycoplasmataceae bacterium CE_OT135]|nr:MAG: hypothetical protein MRECE_16c007 [Mycoplasmataceae bacterium CE_OT135]